MPSNSGHIDDLRPVELLWMLSETRRQVWSREPALQAALVGLSVRGLIAPETDGDGLRPTAGATDSDPELRPYEAEILAAAEDDDAERMVNAVYEYDFRSELTRRGFYRREREWGSVLFGLIPWPTATLARTDRYDAALAELETVREESADAVARGHVRSSQVPLVYAFPNADFYDEFRKNGGELVVDLDEMGVETPDGTVPDGDVLDRNLMDSNAVVNMVAEDR